MAALMKKVKALKEEESDTIQTSFRKFKNAANIRHAAFLEYQKNKSNEKQAAWQTAKNKFNAASAKLRRCMTANNSAKKMPSVKKGGKRSTKRSTKRKHRS